MRVLLVGVRIFVSGNIESRDASKVVCQDIDEPIHISAADHVGTRLMLTLESTHQFRTKNVDLPVQHAPAIRSPLFLGVQIIKELTELLVGLLLEVQ